MTSRRENTCGLDHNVGETPSNSMISDSPFRFISFNIYSPALDLCCGMQDLVPWLGIELWALCIGRSLSQKSPPPGESLPTLLHCMIFTDKNRKMFVSRI